MAVRAATDICRTRDQVQIKERHAARVGEFGVIRSNLGRLALVSSDDAGLQDFTDTLWMRLRQEAEQALAKAPMLAPLFVESILNQTGFEAAVFHRVSSRLKNDILSCSQLGEAFRRALAGDPEIGHAMRADIAAVIERDPACERFIEPFLYFKGFHAIQTHRLAHYLWSKGSVI